MYLGTPCFQAFDGSNNFYKRLGIYDLDCCYLGNPVTVSNPDDGYFILEKVCGCCNKCVVVESARWYAANGYAVGTIRTCPSVNPVNSPINSATKVSLVKNSDCCNLDGSKIYAELSASADCTANPLP